MTSAPRVPFVSLERQYLALRPEVLAEFDRICSSGTYIMGETLQRFEREAAAYCGVRHALGVASGSDALFLALKALGIGPGDEVITCPNSFIATAWTIVAVGAKPVFVDVTDDYTMDAALVERAVTSRSRAIMPVHLTGRPADMAAIDAIAGKHGLHVIEDAAQAIGARYRGRRVGGLGTAAGFSLHPLKNLGIYGDGGLLTTDSDDVFERVLRLRNHGLRNRDECELWGYNSRLDAVQAGIASIKLQYLDTWNSRCREIAAAYRDGVRALVWVPEDQDPYESVYHNFVIRTEQRDALASHLALHGIDTRVHYPVPIHLQDAARNLGHRPGDFPVTERHTQTMLSLPIYPELTAEEVQHVIAGIRGFFAAGGRVVGTAPNGTINGTTELQRS
jgi:dTDP-4-amino-4,6-dideoxygalactose transaminase